MGLHTVGFACKIGASMAARQEATTNAISMKETKIKRQKRRSVKKQKTNSISTCSTTSDLQIMNDQSGM